MITIDVNDKKFIPEYLYVNSLRQSFGIEQGEPIINYSSTTDGIYVNNEKINTSS